MAEETDRKTPRDFLRIVFRNRGRFMLGSVVVAILVLQLALQTWPLKYTASTKFKRRTDVAGQTVHGPDTESFEKMKLTLDLDLKGRSAVEEVAEDLKLFVGLPHDADGQLTREGQMRKQAIVEDLRSRITITWDVKTKEVDLITVSVTDANPRLAQKIPDKLVTNYIDRISQRIKGRLKASHDFLEKQVEGCEARLRDLQKERLDFEARHADAMPNTPGALEERIQTISGDIERLSIRQDTARSSLARFKELLVPSPKATTRPASVKKKIKRPNPEWVRLEEQLRLLNEQLETLRITRTDKHPTVISLQTKIKLLSARVGETPKEEEVEIEVAADREGAGRRRQDPASLLAQIAAAESELEIATREKQRLQDRLRPLLSLMKNFAPVRQKYLDIVEEIRKENLELTAWDKRFKAVKMDLGAEVASKRTHLNTVQAAQEPERPSSPKLMVILGMAVVLGLGCGTGLVFLSSILDRSVTTIDDATRRFHMPVHGIVSEIVSHRRRMTRHLKRWFLTPAIVTAATLAVVVSVLSVVLWLQYPDRFKEWDKDAVGFISKAASDLKSKLPGMD